MDKQSLNLLYKKTVKLIEMYYETDALLAELKEQDPTYDFEGVILTKLQKKKPHLVNFFKDEQQKRTDSK